MERAVFDPDQPSRMMSLNNLKNALRGLFQGDLMPFRVRAAYVLDDMEYPDNTGAQANWAGTGVTVTSNSANKQEGSYCIQAVIDATGNRTLSKTATLDLSGYTTIKLWERCATASQSLKFYLKDGSGNISYWNITTNGTVNTWQQDSLTLASPDSNNGTNAVLSNIVEFGFSNLPASKTFLFDTIKAVSGMSVAVAAAKIGSFYQQVYVGQTRIAFTGGVSPTITAPSANPRIDLLVYNTGTSSLAWIQGTEASSPAEPAFPVDKFPIALIYCKPTMVKVVDYEDKDANPNEGYILKDVRPLYLFGMSTFLTLTDTPSSFSGQAGKVPQVNTGETALEFIDVVKTAGDQTVAGIKTLSSIPVLPASDPTTDNQASRKKYIDDQDAAKGGNAIIKVQQVDGTTDINTTSTSFVDMTNMSLSVVVATGDIVIIDFSIVAEGNGYEPGFRLLRDSTVLQQATEIGGSNAYPSHCGMQYVDTPSAATYTYKVQWKTSGNQINCNPATDMHHRNLRIITIKARTLI